MAARALEARAGGCTGGDAADRGGRLRARGCCAAPTASVEKRVEAARAPGRVLRSENGFLRLLTGEAGEALGLSRRGGAGAVGAGGAGVRAHRALRRVRAGRGAVLVPRPDPGAEVCRAGGERGRLGGDRALGAPLGAGGVADGEGAGRGRGAGDLCAARGRARRARRADAARARGRRRTRRRCSPQAEAAEADGESARGGGALRAVPGGRPGRRGGGVQPGELPAGGRAGGGGGAGAGAGGDARSGVRGGVVQPRRAWWRRAGGWRRRGGISRGRSRSIPTMPMRSSTSRRWSSRPAIWRRRGGWWVRYLELDATSEWARQAARGDPVRGPAAARDAG